MNYKYIMNLSISRLTIFLFLTLSVYIFSISLKYHCVFFLDKIIDLNIREFSYLIKEDFLQVLAIDHLDLLDTICCQSPITISFYIKPPDTTCYYLSITSSFYIKSPYILTIKNKSNYLNQDINRLSNTLTLLLTELITCVSST